MDEITKKHYQEFIKARVIVDHETNCWNWIKAKDPKGYGVTRTKWSNNYLVHRLSYQVFNEPIPNGLFVRHMCHNKCCCNPKHLLTGTQLDNINDNRVSGLPVGGGPKKLNAEQVKQICELHKGGLSMHQLAYAYAVSHKMIREIIRKRSWKYIA